MYQRAALRRSDDVPTWSNVVQRFIAAFCACVACAGGGCAVYDASHARVAAVALVGGGGSGDGGGGRRPMALRGGDGGGASASLSVGAVQPGTAP
eukprot:6206288-Pleurochrysis_carterae.AAC.3